MRSKNRVPSLLIRANDDLWRVAPFSRDESRPTQVTGPSDRSDRKPASHASYGLRYILAATVFDNQGPRPHPSQGTIKRMENTCSSIRERKSLWDARCSPPEHWLACSDSRRRLELTPMTIIVKGESAERIIDSTKPSSIMAGTAGKRTMRAMNCVKRANAAGTRTTVGGMKTAAAGITTATGTITITTATS
jgi:hypothetical protein